MLASVFDYSFRPAPMSDPAARETRFLELLEKHDRKLSFSSLLALWREDRKETGDSFADTFRRLEKKGIVLLDDCLAVCMVLEATLI